MAVVRHSGMETQNKQWVVSDTDYVGLAGVVRATGAGSAWQARSIREH